MKNAEPSEIKKYMEDFEFLGQVERMMICESKLNRNQLLAKKYKKEYDRLMNKNMSSLTKSDLEKLNEIQYKIIFES